MVAESRSSTADLEAAREKLLRTVLDLDEWALDEPRMVGEWSLRELLAHLLVWDGWAAATLPALERGEHVRLPDEAGMNGDALQRFAGRSLHDLIQELQRGSTPILQALAAMTDAQREERRYHVDDRRITPNDLAEGFIQHDLEHAAQIRAWRTAHGA